MSKVPKLRFPGFSGEWEEYSIGDIFDFYSTNSYSRDNLNDISGKVKNIHYGDIHMKFPTILDVSKTHIPYLKDEVDIDKIPPESYCKEGDVIIADASEDYADIGKSIEIKNIGEEKIVSGLHTMLARDNRDITKNGYRGYMLLNENVRKQIKILAAGAKVLGISKTNIGKVKVNIPSKNEQQKIASFFSLIDEKIQKQQEKVEALQDYKKGMMQRIFSQEIRFKEENGEEYPEWQVYSIGDIFDFYATNSYARDCLNNTNGKVKNIHYGDIHMNFPTILDVSKTLIPYLNEGVSIDKIPFEAYCKEGDVIIADASEDYADIGKTIEIKNVGNEQIVAGLHTMLARDNKGITESGYRGYMFLNEGVKKQIKILAVGSKVLGISKSNIAKVILDIPSKEEQNKIASFFSLIDEKFEKEQEKLTILSEWKKGLLQQMFV